jgi:magnesium transporter
MSGHDEKRIESFMEAPHAIFPPQQTVRDTVEAIRELVKTKFVTYGYVTDPEGRLLGVIAMRDLLLARPEQTLDEVMLRNPYSLLAEAKLTDAMKEMVNRHYPCYPVCDAQGRLKGLVWGSKLFEAQAVEITAQAGSMVGVEKEERFATPLLRSLLFRHPWLQFNLLTAFVAAAVVGFFQGTIEKIALLAVFLPVLAGQSGNTGCQALAVTLRGMTLGELRPGMEKGLVFKEAMLGMLNGFLVGLTAAIGMYVYARMQENADALRLAVITCLAMTGACVCSGISGALVPLTLRKLGADPATASSIFLTTLTDVASMGMFLGLATLWLV